MTEVDDITCVSPGGFMRGHAPTSTLYLHVNMTGVCVLCVSVCVCDVCVCVCDVCVTHHRLVRVDATGSLHKSKTG
jgi:hypothetical protein